MIKEEKQTEKQAEKQDYLYINQMIRNKLEQIYAEVGFELLQNLKISSTEKGIMSINAFYKTKYIVIAILLIWF